MDRRKILKITSTTLGFTLTGGALTALLSSCKPENADHSKTTILSKDQLELVRSLAEIILPATDSPGAEDAKVAEYIDKAVAEYFTKPEQIEFIENLKYFDTLSNNKMGHSFQNLELKKQNKVMYLAASEAANNDEHPFNQFRALVISAYFTSELVSTTVLNYDPVPGPYQGCLPIESVGNINSAI